jgi:DNA-binding NarL/FixJ family response regulator
LRRVSTVLVVDDDHAFLDYVVGFLSAAFPDESIVGAADGNTGFTQALELKPRAVVLDVLMPGPNGLSVGTAVAQALPHTRIVIMTGGEGIDEGSLPDDAVYVRKGEGMEDALRAALDPQGP